MIVEWGIRLPIGGEKGKGDVQLSVPIIVVAMLVESEHVKVHRRVGTHVEIARILLCFAQVVQDTIYLDLS